MARIEAPKRPGPFARIAYRMSKRDFGKLPEPLEITAHHPGILRGYGAFEWETGRAKTVPLKLKELAGTKAAAMIGCEFCIDIGSALSTKEGVTAEQLADLPRYRESKHFDELETLVLDYAVAITQTPADVSDELFDSLRRHFDERRLVELTAAIAIENYRARFNWAFGIGSQGFVGEGGACALPERATASAEPVAAA